MEAVAQLALPARQENTHSFDLFATELDWDRFLAYADYHRVIPIVRQSLRQGPLQSVPAWVRETIEIKFQEERRSNLQRYAEWIRLGEAFTKAGIISVALKGFPLAVRLYGDLSFRRVGDLDFLVPLPQVRDAIGVLNRLGYRDLAPRLWTGSRINHTLRFASERPFHGVRSGTAVDLHWRLEWNSGTVRFPVDEVLSSAQPWEGPQGTVLVPTDPVNLALLLTHALGSAKLRLRWLIDLILFMDMVPEKEVPLFQETIIRLGAERWLVDAGWLFETLWTDRAPDRRWMDGLRQSVSLPAKLHLRERLENDPVQSEVPPGPLKSYSATIKARRALTGSVYGALAGAFHPTVEEVLIIPFPRRMPWAYYLVRWARLSARVMKRITLAISLPASRRRSVHHSQPQIDP